MKIHVEFEMEIPHFYPQMSYGEIWEWLRFELNDNGEMSSHNPLAGQEIEPVFGTLRFKKVK